MSQDYIPLATVTLASSASSVTFSNIPSTYRDLIFVYSGTNSDSNAGMVGQFNGDSSASYSTVQMNGFSSGPNAASNSGGTGADFFFGSTERTSGIVQIMDYSATNKHKTALVRTDVGGGVGATRAAAIRYANTNAITSITVSRSGATISTGATFSLYGIVA